MGEEIFLPTYDPYYEVSNFGRVCSVARDIRYVDGRVYHYEPVIIAQRKNRGGYLNVGLSHGKKASVHRLVAIAHIPNPNNLPEINHIDGNKEHNWVGNLEWCTSSHNRSHAVKLGLLVNNKKLSAGQLDLVRELSEEGWSGVSIAKMFKVSTATISLIINHKGVYNDRDSI